MLNYSHKLERKEFSPLTINISEWFHILLKTVQTLMTSHVMLAAAGCAFFETLALFPTISALISIYGLMFDPQTVEPQLRFIQHFLPPTVYQFLGQIIQNVVAQAGSTLTLHLVVSIGLALWSASVGTKGLLTGVNIVYHVEETRSYFKFQLFALSMTFCGILGVILTVAVMVALPAILRLIPLHLFDRLENYFPTSHWVWILGYIIVLLFIVMALSLFYRYGPCRFRVLWRWVFPGSIIAALLWGLCMYGFSFYVAHIANFSNTYGPLGTIVAVMMWFWFSSYIILLGAQLNAQIEKQIDAND